MVGKIIRSEAYVTEAGGDQSRDSRLPATLERSHSYLGEPIPARFICASHRKVVKVCPETFRNECCVLSVRLPTGHGHARNFTAKPHPIVGRGHTASKIIDTIEVERVRQHPYRVLRLDRL